MAYLGRGLGQGVRNRFIYTATAGQTTFSGSDDNGGTLVYTDGTYVDVNLNGVELVSGTDYTATSGTSIVLTTGASLNDTLSITVYDVFAVADTVSAQNGGTFSGDVNVNGDFSVDGGTIKLDGNYPVGTGNVALGNTALDSNVSGASNTAIGADALTANTASGNTAVGEGSGSTITTGEKNTILGSFDGNQDGLDIRTSNNWVVLSDGDGNRHLSMNMASQEVKYGSMTNRFPGHLVAIVPMPKLTLNNIGTSTTEIMSEYFDISVADYWMDTTGVYPSGATKRFVLAGVIQKSNNNASSQSFSLNITYNSNAGNMMTPSTQTIGVGGNFFYAAHNRHFMSAPFELAPGGNQNNHRFQAYLSNLSTSGLTAKIIALNLYVYLS